jgi:site-specific DNA-methyltransferase (adenine-specific)
MQQGHNKLYFGDNLDVLRERIADDSVDLIYLDPPFNSSATYNVLFEEKTGERSAAQITAFEDSWHWGREAEHDYHEMVAKAPKQLADLLQAFRQFLGTNDMMAYLTMMAPRLLELHRVLRPTGSIYLHCDPTASHYLKLLLDAVFGGQHFLNEIIWCYDTGGRPTSTFPKKHDTIFRYGKTKDAVFYYDNVALTRDPSTMHEKIFTDEEGRQYQRNIKAGKEYRYYLDKGVLPNDWWADIQALNPAAKERLGYPTQKPEALLERIIKASTNEGDVVLDPFCGCGTTVSVAERLKRHWLGIDITHLAISLIRHRLHDTFKDDLAPYDVIGEPKDLASAKALSEHDRYQFEWWALSLVEARPAQDKKKGADRGIDGYIYFFDDHTGKAKKIIVQVKSGHVTANQIRDLKGVLDREQAAIGVFITLAHPTRPMETEAVTAGFYAAEHLTKQYPRIQLFTIEDLLAGREVQYPRLGPNGTFKQAERKQKDEGTMQMLML